MESLTGSIYEMETSLAAFSKDKFSLMSKLYMDKKGLEKVLHLARRVCEDSGERFTEKREQIFKILIKAKASLSAYEIVDLYNHDSNAKMPPMSVYRILEFLEKKNLVHKLSSSGKYIACSHLHCGETHEFSQFLICNSCDTATEISISSELMGGLETLVKNAGFAISNPQIELECICDQCARN